MSFFASQISASLGWRGLWQEDRKRFNFFWYSARWSETHTKSTGFNQVCGWRENKHFKAATKTTTTVLSGSKSFELISSSRLLLDGETYLSIQSYERLYRLFQPVLAETGRPQGTWWSARPAKRPGWCSGRGSSSATFSTSVRRAITINKRLSSSRISTFLLTKGCRMA